MEVTILQIRTLTSTVGVSPPGGHIKRSFLGSLHPKFSDSVGLDGLENVLF